MRAGSKGLPGKNLRELNGVPLYRHTLRAAQAADAERVYLSTDIEEVISAPAERGVIVARRPPALAADDAALKDAIADFLATHPGEQIADDATIALLQPTSPLRAAEDIVKSLEAFTHGDVELLISVTEANNNVLKHGLMENGIFIPIVSAGHCFSNRQSLPPVYRFNGAICVFRASWFRARGEFATSRMGAYIMPRRRSHDIDSLADLASVEDLMRQQEKDSAR